MLQPQGGNTGICQMDTPSVAFLCTSNGCRQTHRHRARPDKLVRCCGGEQTLITRYCLNCFSATQTLMWWFCSRCTQQVGLDPPKCFQHSQVWSDDETMLQAEITRKRKVTSTYSVWLFGSYIWETNRLVTSWGVYSRDTWDLEQQNSDSLGKHDQM